MYILCVKVHCRLIVSKTLLCIKTPQRRQLSSCGPTVCDLLCKQSPLFSIHLLNENTNFYQIQSVGSCLYLFLVKIFHLNWGLLPNCVLHSSKWKNMLIYVKILKNIPMYLPKLLPGKTTTLCMYIYVRHDQFEKSLRQGLNLIMK